MIEARLRFASLASVYPICRTAYYIMSTSITSFEYIVRKLRYMSGTCRYLFLTKAAGIAAGKIINKTRKPLTINLRCVGVLNLPCHLYILHADTLPCTVYMVHTGTISCTALVFSLTYKRRLPRRRRNASGRLQVC